MIPVMKFLTIFIAGAVLAGCGGMMHMMSMDQMDMCGMKMEGTQMQGTPSQSKQEKQVDGLTIALSTEPAPPRIGDNRISVKVTEGSLKALSNITVLLTYTMPMPAMVPTTVHMRLGESDQYEATVNLGMGGQWDLTVTVHAPDRVPAKATFSLISGQGGMSGMPGM